MGSEEESCAWRHRRCRPDEHRKRCIKRLNDNLRQSLIGGQVLVTRGVDALGFMTANAILQAVRQFDDFSTANDPFDEHDFGALTCLGHRVFWKIDCYDLKFEFASADASDPHVTTRVITIMLASEY